MMQIGFKTLSVAFACVVTLAANATTIEFTSQGQLKLGAGCSIGICAFQKQWSRLVARAPYEMQRDGIVRFGILAGDERLFEGCVEAEEISERKLRMSYRFRTVKDIEMQAVAVRAVFPAASLSGRYVQADLARHEMSLKANDGKGEAMSFALPLPGGREIKVVCERKIGYAVVNGRRNGDDCSVRMGYNALRKYRKGDEWDIVLTMDFGERYDLRRIRPCVISEGERWVRLDYPKDIVAGSALDFSSQGLVDAPAGKYGRILRVDDHFEFERLPGRAQRFYGVNLCNSACFPSREAADLLVTRLVRMGYNSLRIHHHDAVCVEGTPDGVSLNEKKMERLDYLIAKAVECGLYVTTDLFVSRNVPWRSIGVDRDGNCPMFLYKSLIMCHEPAFENWCAFARNFLLHINPHTGRRYLDEPALSLISLVNEGGLFMGWNAEKSTDPRLRKAWRDWLLSRRKEDPGFHPEADPECLPVQMRGDQFAAIVLFQGWLERTYVRRMKDFLRRLGAKQLLTNDNCGPHWMALQEATEEYDYVDDHFYVDHPKFLDKPWRLPSRCDNENPVLVGNLTLSKTAFARISDKPFTVTEWSFAGPGRYRGVGGIMTGAMAALQNWDGLWHFAYSHDIRNVRDCDWAPSAFDLSIDPLAQASDRASLCLFLRHDLEPFAKTNGVSLLVTQKSVDNADSVFEAAPTWADAAWNCRVSTCLARERAGGGLVVARERAAESESAVNARKAHAPVSLDRIRGSLLIDTPRTSGGFVPGGRLTAGALAFTVKEAPATIWVSSLDDSPIPTSKRLLLTHLTDVQAAGNRYEDESRKVLYRLGHGILAEVGSADVSLRLDRPERYVVYELKANGIRMGLVPSVVRDGSLDFTVSTRGPFGGRLLYEIVDNDM